jgi:ABC-2 type transport system permease protein
MVENSGAKKAITSYKRAEIIKILLSLGIIILINFLASFVFFRWDLTSEKKYSLSKPTEDLVKNLDDVVYFKVYLGSQLNPDFAKLKSAVKELLDEFRNHSKANIQYEFFDIYSITDKEDIQGLKKQFYEKGIISYTMRSKSKGELKSQIIYPGIDINYKGKSTSLNLIQSAAPGINESAMINSAIEVLEYEVTNGIRKLKTGIKPGIAFLDGHGELDSLQTKDLFDGLKEYYNVGRMTINGKLNALNNIDALIVAQPDSAFNEKDKFVIDQFIMRGGKVLWLIDKVNANEDSLKKRGITFGIDNNLNLDDLFFKYGVRINNQIVFDGQCAQIPLSQGTSKASGPQYQLFPWYFMPLIKPDNGHPIVKNLDMIKFNVSGTIDTIANDAIKKTVLLKSSRYTKLLFTPTRISLDMAALKVKREQFNKPYQPVAVLLEGLFESEFYNRIPVNIQNDSAINFQKQCAKPNKMIVIADGDVAANEVLYQRGMISKLGYDRFTGTLFSNKAFLVNCINYLLGDQELMSVRGREMKLRLLDREKVMNQKSQWQWINLIVPIAIILFFGIIYIWLRKRKYAR